MAGTVKAPASNSPRPRARYSSWTLDEPQPRAWLADQMSQRQASRSRLVRVEDGLEDEAVQVVARAARRGR